jgi:hypothetical protein
MISRACVAVALVLALTVANVGGFLIPPLGSPSRMRQSSSRSVARCRVLLQMTEEDDRLRALGYSEDEIRRSKAESSPEDIKVRVDVVDDIDAFSLTAVGFGLIALNFLVFANMGDGGIAGVVATIMNTWGN